jgi:hypothetical protein
VRTGGDSSHRQLQNHRNKTVEREIVRKHSEDTAPGQWGTVAKAGRSGGCGGLASEASNEGLVSESFGGF